MKNIAEVLNVFQNYNYHFEKGEGSSRTYHYNVNVYGNYDVAIVIGNHIRVLIQSCGVGKHWIVLEETKYPISVDSVEDAIKTFEKYLNATFVFSENV